MRAVSVAILCSAALAPLSAQDSFPQLDQAPAVDRTLATLHGTVRNAVTGEGVPRALVEIEGDADTGVLTDGDGRFEIPDVPVGPQVVEVRRPGFFDASGEAEPYSGDGRFGAPHSIRLAAEMPNLVFSLTPACTIRGRIDLSTGDPAEGIEVELVRRTVQDGRALWQQSRVTKTRSDGTYRFGGLANGQYKLYTTPVLDNGLALVPVATGKAVSAAQWGYASVFYPDARDPSGAAKIAVANGEEAQANFTLTRELFQTVAATVVWPQAAPASNEPGNSSVQVMDGAGDQLLYPVQYDRSAQTIQAALPDGSYSMLVSSTPPIREPENSTIAAIPGSGVLVGTLDFSVAGHPVTGLRVPLSAAMPSPVDVSVMRSGAETPQTQNGRIAVMLSQAGEWMGGAMVGQYATGGAVTGPLQASYMAPGAYWVHTYLSGGGLCESSFTAGGASLGREPVTIGLSGTAAPLELALRDDCAALTLTLPENLTGIAPGEEPFYSVYAVPDFDFTKDLNRVVLRPSMPTSTLYDLTPGSYHVYIFEGDKQLEYRNPAALAALPNPGQAVTLSPGAVSTLVLEAPGQ